MSGLFRHWFHHDDPAPTPAPAQLAPSRKGLYFGYFGSDDAQVSETAGHVNLLFAAFGSSEQLAARIAAANMPAILDVSDCLFTSDTFPRQLRADAEAQLRLRFDAMRGAGALEHIVALYVIDEPERQSNISSADIGAACALTRLVAASYGVTPALHICYGDGKDYRGLEFIDWAGVDSYGKGAGVLADDVQALKSALREDQRLVLYPGGADPWRNAPEPFYAYAQTDSQVIAIVAFIWLAANNGIVSNGMADAYRAVGKAVINAKESAA